MHSLLLFSGYFGIVWVLGFVAVVVLRQVLTVALAGLQPMAIPLLQCWDHRWVSPNLTGL